tara:strand:+ start:551 stop:1084 length:534 start_codon:yes stop_codon:yes gene_type:complete
MEGKNEVSILRIGHRPGRDDRITTHVGLVARAFGADRVIFPDIASSSSSTINEVSLNFGGGFKAESTSSVSKFVKSWDGSIVHLTMYGQPIDSHINEVIESHQSIPLLIIVGAEKVPFFIYEAADWNISVTNQPHSEIAALAILLDRLFQGNELNQSWDGAKQKIIPQKSGKLVEGD